MLYLLLLVVAVLPATVTSQKQGFCRIDGQRAPSPYSIYGYYECKYHQWVYQQCLNGYEFDKKSLRCEKIYQPPSPPPQICYVGETRPYLFDNTKYEICVDGYSWAVQSCPKNYIFNNGQCRPLTTTTRTTPYYTTTTTTQATHPTPEVGRCSGSPGYKADPYDCTKYYQCVNGWWMQRPCGPGTAWDQYNLTCNFYDLVCQNKTPESTTKPPYSNTFKTI